MGDGFWFQLLKHVGAFMNRKGNKNIDDGNEEDSGDNDAYESEDGSVLSNIDENEEENTGSMIDESESNEENEEENTEGMIDESDTNKEENEDENGERMIDESDTNEEESQEENEESTIDESDTNGEENEEENIESLIDESDTNEDEKEENYGERMIDESDTNEQENEEENGESMVDESDTSEEEDKEENIESLIDESDTNEKENERENEEGAIDENDDKESDYKVNKQTDEYEENAEYEEENEESSEVPEGFKEEDLVGEQENDYEEAINIVKKDVEEFPYDESYYFQPIFAYSSSAEDIIPERFVFKPNQHNGIDDAKTAARVRIQGGRGRHGNIDGGNYEDQGKNGNFARSDHSNVDEKEKLLFHNDMYSYPSQNHFDFERSPRNEIGDIDTRSLENEFDGYEGNRGLWIDGQVHMNSPGNRFGMAKDFASGTEDDFEETEDVESGDDDGIEGIEEEDIGSVGNGMDDGSHDTDDFTGVNHELINDSGNSGDDSDADYDAHKELADRDNYQMIHGSRLQRSKGTFINVLNSFFTLNALG